LHGSENVKSQKFWGQTTLIFWGHVMSSVEGSWICEGSNFGILHRLSRSPLTRLRYRHSYWKIR